MLARSFMFFPTLTSSQGRCFGRSFMFFSDPDIESGSLHCLLVRYCFWPLVGPDLLARSFGSFFWSLVDPGFPTLTLSLGRFFLVVSVSFWSLVDPAALPSSLASLVALRPLVLVVFLVVSLVTHPTSSLSSSSSFSSLFR